MSTLFLKKFFLFFFEKSIDKNTVLMYTIIVPREQKKKREVRTMKKEMNKAYMVMVQNEVVMVTMDKIKAENFYFALKRQFELRSAYELVNETTTFNDYFGSTLYDKVATLKAINDEIVKIRIRVMIMD